MRPLCLPLPLLPRRSQGEPNGCGDVEFATLNSHSSRIRSMFRFCVRIRTTIPLLTCCAGMQTIVRTSYLSSRCKKKTTTVCFRQNNWLRNCRKKVRSRWCGTPLPRVCTRKLKQWGLCMTTKTTMTTESVNNKLVGVRSRQSGNGGQRIAFIVARDVDFLFSQARANTNSSNPSFPHGISGADLQNRSLQELLGVCHSLYDQMPP